MKLSVILCTHNPRRDYLERTLESLAAQTLPHGDWEFLLIDNASNTSLSKEIPIDWHPNARVIREEQLGLTPARLRGIGESTGNILCFADDDNVLSPTYLEGVLRIADTMPHIGCWGGEIHGEYETPPPAWFKPYQGMLVVRPLRRDIWGNAYRYDDASPCGAGLCVRRNVVNVFLENCRKSKLRLSLGRTGQSMSSGEDTDLAYTAIDLGYGTGRFKAMQMTHLIPSGRLDEGYLKRLCEGMWESAVYLDSLREETRQNIPAPPSWKDQLRDFLKSLKRSRVECIMTKARKAGIRKGLRNLESIRSE